MVGRVALDLDEDVLGPVELRLVHLERVVAEQVGGHRPQELVLVAEADVALVLPVEEHFVRGRRGLDLVLVVDEAGRVPAPRDHQRGSAGYLQGRDLLELGVHVLRDVRDAVELDGLDEALLVIAHRPEPVGLEEVVLARPRELELGEGLRVAAHAHVVDPDARGIEERLDALRLHVPAPGQPVHGARRGRRTGRYPHRGAGQGPPGQRRPPEELPSTHRGAHTCPLLAAPASDDAPAVWVSGLAANTRASCSAHHR